MTAFLRIVDAAFQPLSNLARDICFPSPGKRVAYFETRVGIGASFALSFEHDNIMLLPGTWCVASVPPESTAFQAGLCPSDALLEVYTTYCTQSRRFKMKFGGADQRNAVRWN